MGGTESPEPSGYGGGHGGHAKKAHLHFPVAPPVNQVAIREKAC